MTEGTIAKWLKSEGDVVKSGDLLAEIETDKATMELEAVEEGILGKIIQPEGSEGIPVNEPIAVILAEGEDVSATGILTAEATAPMPTSDPTTAPERDHGHQQCLWPEPRYLVPMSVFLLVPWPSVSRRREG